MALSLKWWTDLKARPENKVDGKAAPETEFEKRLKVYDKALAAHSNGPIPFEKACKALDEVEKARSASSTELTKRGFTKLAVFCNQNSRVLATLIAGERTQLAAAKPQIMAMAKIGLPVVNASSGPGGNTIRQGKFNTLHGRIKHVNSELRRVPQLSKENVDQFLIELSGLAKDMKLYCGDRAELRTLQGDFDAALASFKTVKAKWGDKSAFKTEMQKIGTKLPSMVNARYVP